MVVNKLTLSVAYITAVLLLTRAFCSASACTGLDPVVEALLQADGTQVQLSPMFVDSVLGDYVTVRNLAAGSVPIPVYVGTADVPLFSTVSILGTLATIESQSRRVLIADSIAVFRDGRGNLSPPAPWLDSDTWPYMSDDIITHGAGKRQWTPPVPSPPVAETSPTISAPDGSVVKAKSEAATAQGRSHIASIPKESGSVTLQGKIVSAVFFNPGTNTVSFFYVQETDSQGHGILGGAGIKVVPQSWRRSKPGNWQM